LMRRHAGMLDRFPPYVQCERDARARAATLARRQHDGNVDRGLARAMRLHTPEDWRAPHPALEARAEDAYTGNADAHHGTPPKIRLQLLPPNPKELLSTRRTGRSCECSTM